MSLDRYRSIVGDWEAFVAASRRPEPTVFRIRTGRIGEAELLDRLHAQGFRTRPVDGLPAVHQVEDEPYPVPFTVEHWLGLLYVQQASTAVAAPALAPRPGERVLDLCAAPGGKTTHLSDLMEDRGPLVAVDVDENRIRALLGNVYRLGHTNVLAVAGDGRELPEEATFDRVLVDAPCSGEGTLRRRGGEPPRPSRGFMGYVTRAQEALLRKAVRLARPGGRILYVTCTFSPLENEAVVHRVLRDAPVRLVPLALPVPHAPGITGWEGDRYDDALEGAARILPHHLDSGGLFLALLERTGGDGEPAGASTDGPERSLPGWSPVPPAFTDVADGVDVHEDPSGEVAARVADTLERLEEAFGVGPGAWEGTRFVERGGRLWLHSAGSWPFASWTPGSWRPVSVGFRAVEFDSGGRPRPTNDLLRWLGPRILRGRVPLDPAALEAVLARQPLEAPEPRGYVALALEGDVLGRGLSLDRGLRSEIPKARNADLRRGHVRRRDATAAADRTS